MTQPARARAEEQLVNQCLEHLRRLPFSRRVSFGPWKGTGHTPRFDGVVSITTPAGEHRLPCELKRAHLPSDAAETIVHIAKRTPGLLVVAPSVGRDLGDLFERAGVNFIDAAGNCHVALGDKYVARIQGRSPLQKVAADRALRAPGYRALFALLVRPELIDAPSRAIAAEAEVSPQTANDLRQRLVDQGLVLESSTRFDWAPGRIDAVRTLWLAGFSTSLSPSLILGRYRAMEKEPAALEQRIEPILDACCDWRYGGGAAAMRLTSYYRGERTVLYTHDAPVDLPQRLRLLRDPAGPVQLMRTPGKLAFESPDARSVHPLLAYADLLAEGHDRAREAAGELYDRFLRDTGSATRR
jgi:hypothetical protein